MPHSSCRLPMNVSSRHTPPIYEIPKVMKQVDCSTAGAFHPHTYGISLNPVPCNWRQDIYKILPLTSVLVMISWNPLPNSPPRMSDKQSQWTHCQVALRRGNLKWRTWRSSGHEGTPDKNSDKEKSSNVMVKISQLVPSCCRVEHE